MADSPSKCSTLITSPVPSPTSGQKFFIDLDTRVKLLRDRISQDACGRISLNSVQETTSKDDSELLMKGFDHVSCTLSQLSDDIDNALQRARCASQTPPLSELICHNLPKYEGCNEKGENSHEKEASREENGGRKRKVNGSGDTKDEKNNEKHRYHALDDKRRLRTVAISIAANASSLAEELKVVKSNLLLTQDQCAALEEENRILRRERNRSVMPDEDDLVTLQVEALLADKSRLANENAFLARENQSLHQLVEYYEITTTDTSTPWEHFVDGICLDFSSPSKSNDDVAENE